MSLLTTQARADRQELRVLKTDLTKAQRFIARLEKDVTALQRSTQRWDAVLGDNDDAASSNPENMPQIVEGKVEQRILESAMPMYSVSSMD